MQEGGKKMNYKVQHITNKRKIIRNMVPEYLTIHSTGNPKSTAQNERDNLDRPNNTTTTGFHIVVDEKEAIECIPFNKVAYHAGDGAYGQGNSKSIGLEICESGNRAKTLENAVKVSAKILHEMNWGIDRLKRHYDWSRKNCPRILSANNWSGWNKFKRDVQKELNRLKGVDKVTVDKNKPSKWAEKEWEWGIKNGITDGSRPKDPATREEVIALIHRALKVK